MRKKVNFKTKLTKEEPLKSLIIILTGIILFSGCSANRINSEFAFGNKLAKQGLWKEAYYRWNKALEEGEKGAAIHNNIAIALEYQDRLKEAESEYVKALKLSPGNEYIKRNLQRLKRRMNPEDMGFFYEGSKPKRGKRARGKGGRK